MEDFSIDDYRRVAPRFQGENFESNRELVRQVQEIATEKRCKPAQVALSWVLGQGEDIVAIPGTKHRQYLHENVGSADIKLTADERDFLCQVFSAEAVAGPRYAEAGMAMIDSSK